MDTIKNDNVILIMQMPRELKKEAIRLSGGSYKLSAFIRSLILEKLNKEKKG